MSPRTGSWKHAVFWGIVVAINAACLLAVYKGYRYYTARQARAIVEAGMRVNRAAWEATYAERGLSPPAAPRDGFWGARIGDHVKHPLLGWTSPTVHIPGLLELGEHGVQHLPAPNGPGVSLVVVGASVAFGAYASSIDRTYFARLQQMAERIGLPLEVTVIASGGWKSGQEVDALKLYGLASNPDAVLFLDGLNDLTVGSNARTWFGVPTKTLDGSRWHLLYHEHDYDARVDGYLDNVRSAAKLLRDSGITAVFALQPALFEKPQQSALERELETYTLQFHSSKQALQNSYRAMRQGLAALARSPGVLFVDCSNAFAAEHATTFADLWHFSDPGHDLVAACLSRDLLPVLKGLARERVERYRRAGGAKGELRDHGVGYAG